jgi:hypothetical protein
MIMPMTMQVIWDSVIPGLLVSGTGCARLKRRSNGPTIGINRNGKTIRQKPIDSFKGRSGDEQA